MEKLVFKAYIYKKTGKIFFLILFPIYKNFDRIFKKNKENL